MISDKHHLASNPVRLKRWAHRVKTGCITCRRRKVKCDEIRPACYRCVAGGRQCQGYALATASSIPLLLYRLPTSLPQFDSTRHAQEIIFLLPRVNGSFPNIADDLQKKICSKLELLLAHLPCRTGHSAVLDAAIECFAAGIRDAWEQNQAGKSDQALLLSRNIESLRLYTPAITKLRQALSDPKESLAAETLFAALLLCCFDGLKSNNLDALRRHLIGISMLFRHRGPSRYTNSFELDLLYHHVQFIALACVWDNSPYYLHDDEWQDLAQLLTFKEPEQDQLVGKVVGYLELMATLVAHCSTLVKSYFYDPTTPLPQHSAILQQLTDSEHSFIEWLYRIVEDLFGWRKTADVASLVPLMEVLHESDGTRPSVESIGGGLLGIMLSRRLRIALNCPDAIAVEAEVQKLAGQVELLHNKYRQDSMFPVPYILLQITSATLGTRETWLTSVTAMSRKRRKKNIQVISAKAFGQWLKLAGVNFRL